jgi:hypothetical protein
MNLMYISNDAIEINLVTNHGANVVFIDLENYGKQERQKGKNTFISTHSISDISRVKPFINASKLLVRINPINGGSYAEIYEVIEQHPDIIMLPYITSIDQVIYFIDIVDEICKKINVKVKKMLLIETKFSVENFKKILLFKEKIDFIHIGLNDLSIDYNIKFMFAFTLTKTFNDLIGSLNFSGIPFGVGGISALNTGLLDPKLIIAKHIQWKSQFVIASREFRTLYNSSNTSPIIGALENFKRMYYQINKLDSLQFTDLIYNYEVNLNKIIFELNGKTN